MHTAISVCSTGYEAGCVCALSNSIDLVVAGKNHRLLTNIHSMTAPLQVNTHCTRAGTQRFENKMSTPDVLQLRSFAGYEATRPPVMEDNHAVHTSKCWAMGCGQWRVSSAYQDWICLRIRNEVRPDWVEWNTRNNNRAKRSRWTEQRHSRLTSKSHDNRHQCRRCCGQMLSRRRATS